MLSFVKDWGGFEQFIAELHRDGDVQVDRDVTLTGKSGVPRQIDVLVTHKYGMYSHKILIECKYWSKHVERADVDEMRSTLEDLNADKAVFFTTKGYQSGAETFAKYHGISLYTVRDVFDSDWGAPGRVIDFYIHFVQRGVMNIRTNLEVNQLDLLLEPDLPKISIQMDGPGRTETKIIGQTEKVLENVIDESSRRALDEVFPSDTKGFTLNNGEDGSAYLMCKNVRVEFPGDQWLLRNGKKLTMRCLVFDLCVKITQMRFMLDRMNNYKYAVIIEDKINNQLHVAMRKNDEDYRLISPHLREKSMEDALENGTVFRVYMLPFFNPDEMLDKQEKKYPVRNMKELVEISMKKS